MMRVVFTQQAQKDFAFWQTHDKKIAKKIELLIQAIQGTPFSGIGKPEALKFTQTGYWSRRINHEHRLVYKIHDKTIYIAECRYHY